MVTQASMVAAEKLLAQGGWTELSLPAGANTPVPGVMLFANEKHDIRQVLPDGRVVDLLAIQTAAYSLFLNLARHRALELELGHALQGEKL